MLGPLMRLELRDNQASQRWSDDLLSAEELPRQRRGLRFNSAGVGLERWLSG